LSARRFRRTKVGAKTFAGMIRQRVKGKHQGNGGGSNGADFRCRHTATHVCFSSSHEAYPDDAHPVQSTPLLVKSVIELPALCTGTR
jgi:hypothetical protein